MFQAFLFKTLTSMLAATMGASFGLLPISKVNIQIPNNQFTNIGVTKFTSCTALKNQIAQSEEATTGMMRDLALPTMTGIKTMAQPVAQESAGNAASDYSQTNIQVQGVDEADIVKQDGEYIYHLSLNVLHISKINPANQAELKSSTEIDSGLNGQDIYISGNRLILMGNKWEGQVYPMPLAERATSIVSPWRGQNVTVVQIWDIADRSQPKKIRNIEFDGSLSTSRMIAGRVYIVMNSWSPWDALDVLPNEKNLVPAYKDSKSGTEYKPMAGCADVAFFDPQGTRQYLAVASVPVSGEGEIDKQVILGSSETVYASLNNLYVARQDWSRTPIRDTAKDTDSSEKTLIYKFTLKDGKINFQSRGFVLGHLLNQFSLDEFEDNLRVATTKGYVWDRSNPSTNNVYILGSDMKSRGMIEGIAPGETIYSVRFMGKKGYMVTFKKVDPFFVFDLSNPDAPKILGKLKIPGYSDYLHPMDENHIIGIGKNAEDAAEQDFAWYQGMKMAIFDVTDVEHPKELWKVDIGDRGTDSPALHDHKAFLYSASKQLLALPVRLAELSPEAKADTTREGNEYGDFTFQGAYVYRLTLDKGFEFLGRISHYEDNDVYLKSGYYWGEYNNDVQRIMYADNSLVTVSNAKVQLNQLYDLKELGRIKYPNVKQDEPIYYME